MMGVSKSINLLGILLLKCLGNTLSNLMPKI
jgi:hypothetical protein